MNSPTGFEHLGGFLDNRSSGYSNERGEADRVVESRKSMTLDHGRTLFSTGKGQDTVKDTVTTIELMFNSSTPPTVTFAEM